MVEFRWIGTDARGRTQRGECSAPSLTDAAAQLRGRGLSPVSVERSVPEGPNPLSSTADAFATFNRHLAEMTGIGLPLARAVKEISSGLRRGRLKAALQGIEAELREGRTLDEAVARVPGPFPPYYRWMLKAGAASGNLPSVLSAVARNADAVRLARRAFVEALAYPAVVLLFGAIFATAFAVVFLPIYQEICAHYAMEPPITVGLFLSMLRRSREVPLAAGALLALGIAAVAWFRRTATGERVLRNIPVVGRIRSHLSTARLLGALSVMLRTNTPLPAALPVAVGAAGSRELDQALDRLSALAAEGRGLGELLAEAPGIAPDVAGYLSVSERLGGVPQAAADTAHLLTEQAAAESESLFMLLMPAALLVAGGVIAALLASFVSGYFGFIEQIKP